MNINYGMEIVRATEIAALTAARIQGLGDHRNILNQTRKAIAKTLHRLPVTGTVINDRFTGREQIYQLPSTIGSGSEETDLLVIALEAYHSAANGRNNSTSYAAIAKSASLQNVPNLSMYKMVVGAKVGDVIDITQPPARNVKRVARALRKYTENVTVCILNHHRHKMLIDEIRSCGARIKLIEEGEISGCLSAIMGEKADIYIGYGYAHEAVFVAAAIRCFGGYFEGKIIYENEQEYQEAEGHGISDFTKIFRVQDLVKSKQVAIAGTGITDGEFLEGVRFTPTGAITNSFVARGESRTYRSLETRHFFDYKPVF
ncbi:MAG: fructose-bisphosphatase class II [Deltaproteobacteria bacterium]|nr:MAG: fructose-bisphosphatase class II [Deltaproteobacteria bacterium]